MPDVAPACTCQRGATVWLTGLPSAGKSTITHGCEPELRARGLRVEILDGDAVRPHLAAARGYSREDRAINIRRIGWVAELLARNGVLVLVSAIAPFRDVRDQVRAAHAGNGTRYLEVHVSTPVEVAAERDVKGLYARQRVGEISGLTGVDDPYEEPLAPGPRHRRARAPRERVGRPSCSTTSPHRALRGYPDPSRKGRPT